MAHTESIHTLTTWAKATEAWDEGKDRDALNCLVEIENLSSKHLFNIGCAHLRLGNYQQAEQSFTSAIAKDEHMAIAYFQRGCVYVKANRLREAVQDFEECQKRFRGRSVIDYGQLGLRYKLYDCEAKHNCGVSEALRGDTATAEQHIEKAFRSKVERRHKVIGESLQQLKDGKTPSLIEIPHDAIYRPPQAKLANLSKKDYLGKAKVISSLDHYDDFSGFVGPKKWEEQKKLSPVPSPDASPSVPRHHIRKERSPIRIPSPIIPNKEQLVAASKTLSPKIEKLNISENGSNWYIRQGSRDDSTLKVPPSGAPLLPPKGNNIRSRPPGSADHSPIRAGSPNLGDNRRASEGILKIGQLTGRVHRDQTKLPPPPNRPPPKLDRKPLPTIPSETKSPVETKKDNVQVEFRCNSAKVVKVPNHSTLKALVSTACKLFTLQADSIHLWRRRSEDGELDPILTEQDMQEVWQVHRGSLLTLWCYAKE